MATTREQRGFTLIELLIVMVIIGLLASLVAPDMFKHVGKSKRKAAQAQMEMLATALDTYRLDVGSYPAALQDLITPNNARGWEGPYLQKALPNDPWDNPYVYKMPGDNGALYTLRTLGKDGKEGGEGEDADFTR